MPTNNTENIYSTEFENDPNPIPSSKIGYDNTESGLEATTVQGAIDELDSKIKASDEASEITYDNTESGLEADNVQAAIDEVASEFDNLKNKYTFLGEEKVSLPVAEGKTFADLFLTGNELFTMFNNYLATLEDNILANIKALYVTPTFGAWNMHNVTCDMYDNEGIPSNADIRFAGPIWDGGNSQLIIGTARAATSGSHINRMKFASAGGAVSYDGYSSSATSVTSVQILVEKYKKI